MTKSTDSDNSSFNDFSELTDLNSQELDADELKEVLAAELICGPRAALFAANLQ